MNTCTNPKCSGGRVALCSLLIDAMTPDQEPFESGVEEDLGDSVVVEPTTELLAYVCVECGRIDGAWMEGPGHGDVTTAKKQLAATRRLSNIYFRIASNVLGRNQVRRLKDEAIRSGVTDAERRRLLDHRIGGER